MHRLQTDLNHGYRSTLVETHAAKISAAEEQALAVFGQWLDGELEQLVARWAPLAAPNATRSEQATRRLRKPGPFSS